MAGCFAAEGLISDELRDEDELEEPWLDSDHDRDFDSELNADCFESRGFCGGFDGLFILLEIGVCVLCLCCVMVDDGEEEKKRGDDGAGDWRQLVLVKKIGSGIS